MEGALHVVVFFTPQKHNEHLFFTWSSNDSDECLVIQRTYSSSLLAAVEIRKKGDMGKWALALHL
jgi:hypothetical protein